MKKRFFVIDGHALCYRAYYAFIRSPLVNSSGQNTSAIFGFARMLFKLISEQKPDYLAVAFDPPRKTFRHELFADYKANRQKMPDDLRPQIDEIKRMVELAGIARLEEDGYEADDVLGSIAKRYARDDVEVVLVTGDKDAYQLVGEGVRIYAAKKGISEYEMYDAAAVTEKLGVRPEQVIDYMALTGDASDNVPGVKGIGEKNAQKLIAAFGSIDAIYGRLDEIKGKQREHLETGRESAYLSRDLVTIRTDVPLRIGIEEARMPALDVQAMREYFNRLEMKSVAQDFFSGTADAASPAPETGETREKDYRIVRTASGLREAMRAVREAGMVSFDTETTSVDPVEAELVGMSFSVREHSGCYVPVACGGLFESGVLGVDEALAIVSPVLADVSVMKIGQNIKYDIVVLKKYGVEVRGVHFDTMIASYLLDPAARNHNLDDMAEKFLNYKTITYGELVGKGKNAVPITEVPVERVAEYAIEDADVTLRLHRVLAPMLASENLEKLFFNIEMPLVDVLAEMEWKGVRIDTAHFAALGAENSRMLAEEEQRVYDIAGGRFNINSTRELASVLFEKLALKPVKKTKTGFSTDIQVLEELRGRHEIIDHLIAYRTLVKLKSTYIDTLPRLVSERTGRIHTSYNQTIVATGRLSSSSPNLQNIPVRDEFGRTIRRGFVPEKGRVMMAADYSQIELRIAAHLSGDENMIRAFREGIDIHRMTASSVFGVAIDAVTPDMRRQAKIINFATIYGVSPFGLSQQADISIRDAAEFIRRYFETYPGFRRYVDETIEFARTRGYVQTLLGRKRRLPEINSTTSFRREGAERIAINTPIQGTSADLIKIAMARISRAMCEAGMKTSMIMQVHDELVFEAPEEELATAETTVRREMEHALELAVPVTVDIGWGASWEEAH